MAERGGFEPPWELVAPKSISSRSRYDHFGTSPLILSNISNATICYNERFRPACITLWRNVFARESNDQSNLISNRHHRDCHDA